MSKHHYHKFLLLLLFSYIFSFITCALEFVYLLSCSLFLFLIVVACLLLNEDEAANNKNNQQKTVCKSDSLF